MEHWIERAACAGDLPARYELDEGPHREPRAMRDRRAALLCAGCPVQAECAWDALVHSDVGVVRAGLWLAPGTNPRAPDEAAQRRLAAIAHGVGVTG